MQKSMEFVFAWFAIFCPEKLPLWQKPMWPCHLQAFQPPSKLETKYF